MRRAFVRTFPMVGIVLATALALGCGSGSGGSQSNNQGGGGGGNTPSNVQPISVNGGPEGLVDGAFTSVTVCAPASTSSCQTISGILVDTGSFGLRVLSSALTITLPQQMDSSGSQIAECAPFADGVTWGDVETADVKIAGEAASSVPIQVIGAGPSVPASCSAQGQPMDTLSALGANGLLGVGQAIQDCGPACTVSGTQNPGWYSSCPTSGCTTTTESLALQVQNPVASFTTDNNGVIIELPAVSGEAASVNGSMIFGIGTQSNNGLGSSTTIFGTDDFGDFTTTYKNVKYTSFLDSGSNGIYFLDSATTGLPQCTKVGTVDISFWYCPTTTQSISVVNSALVGGATGTVTFPVGDAASLIMSNDAAINGLAGPSPNMVDFGLPFFFGRNVYVAIVGKSTPGGNGPYTAY